MGLLRKLAVTVLEHLTQDRDAVARELAETLKQNEFLAEANSELSEEREKLQKDLKVTDTVLRSTESIVASRDVSLSNLKAEVEKLQGRAVALRKRFDSALTKYSREDQRRDLQDLFAADPSLGVVEEETEEEAA